MTRMTLLMTTAAIALAATLGIAPASAQTEAAAATAADIAEQPEPLTDEELEILVARIALYPDELVAVVVASSLYPLQIVEAQRFLDEAKTKKDLKPKSTWDGSVVSLLNYPPIVKMMSDDLDWTQALGEAITYQEKDVITAIQQLREKAVAEGIIKTDGKVKVVEENGNIVIQPASAEVIYVPQYEPEVLYETNYVAAPIYYDPDPYPYYYYPGATYWAGFVTGAIWGGIVDWDDGFWGGDWHGNGADIDIDCNKCFNDVDFNGKLDINNVDWTKVDRSKISFDKNQFNKLDKSKVKNNIKKNDFNKVENKVGGLKKTRPTTLPGKTKPVKDVRASTLDSLKAKPDGGKVNRPSALEAGNAKKPDLSGARDKAERPSGKNKPAARPDNRPKNPSPMGDIKQGKKAKIDSNRGAKSLESSRTAKPNLGGGGGGGGKKKKPKLGGGGGGKKRR